MPHFFEDDDLGYSQWLSDQPTGFVGNMTRSFTPAYFMVHRATCSTITPGSSRSNGPGAFTAHDHRKVCSADLAAVVAWGEEKGFTGIRACGRCLPDVELARR